MLKCLKWAYPFSVKGCVNHFQCVLQLMMTYYVETLELGVSILSDGVGKQFLVRPAADDVFQFINIQISKLPQTFSTKGEKISSKDCLNLTN